MRFVCETSQILMIQLSDPVNKKEEKSVQYKKHKNETINSGTDGRPVLEKDELDDEDTIIPENANNRKFFFDQDSRSASIITEETVRLLYNIMKMDREERQDCSCRRKEQ